MESHLLQMRGLKLQNGDTIEQTFRSHLLQMRGLKPSIYPIIDCGKSRIFYRCVD